MQNKGKKIWIVNFHTAPPGYALNPRYIKLIPYLQRAGFEITVISSAYLRRYDRFLTENNEKYHEKIYDGIPFIHIKSIKYSGNGIKRMLSIFQFSIRLMLIGRKLKKPDIIYHNIHVPFDVPVYFAARLFKAKYIAEVWDLWPEFFHRMGLVSKKNLLLKFAYQIEKWIYKKSNAIVFTLEGGRNYLIEKGWDLDSGGKIDLNKVHYINNGVDIKEFQENIISNRIDDPDLDNDEIFRVMYIGSIHLANNLKQVLDAANILKDVHSIKFFIYGDGPERSNLEKYCIQLGLNNVLFKNRHLPFNQLPYVLSKSSLNLMNYKKDFGDYGVSPGKLFLYLASGKPILSNVKINYCVITENQLGLAKNINTPAEYADAILSIKNLPITEYQNLCHRVKTAAREFDFEVLSQKLINVFNQYS